MTKRLSLSKLYSYNASLKTLIFVPNLWMCFDKIFHQLFAFSYSFILKKGGEDYRDSALLRVECPRRIEFVADGADIIHAGNHVRLSPKSPLGAI